MPEFDREIRSRSWMLGGLAVSGWVGTKVTGLPIEGQIPWLVGGFVIGAVLATGYDWLAFHWKSTSPEHPNVESEGDAE